MLTTKQLETLALARYELLRPIDLISPNKTIVLEHIINELKDLEPLGSEDVCLKRHSRFGILGSSPEDFKERIIDLENGDFILAGIRFKNLELDKPFVSVWSSSEKISVEFITEVIKKEFWIFKPKFLQMVFPYANETQSTSMDRFIVAGAVKAIPNLLSDEVELHSVTSIDFYQRYKEEYEAVYQKDPELRHEIRMEDFEDFEDLLKEGLLFKVFIKGNFAGIMGGKPSNLYGCSGVCIHEEILFQDYKGQGYGPLIQNAFARKLENRFELLWGTISPKNVRSLKTALRNGRKITEVEYFFDLNSGIVL